MSICRSCRESTSLAPAKQFSSHKIDFDSDKISFILHNVCGFVNQKLHVCGGQEETQGVTYKCRMYFVQRSSEHLSNSQLMYKENIERIIVQIVRLQVEALQDTSLNSEIETIVAEYNIHKETCKLAVFSMPTFSGVTTPPTNYITNFEQKQFGRLLMHIRIAIAAVIGNMFGIYCAHPKTVKTIEKANYAALKLCDIEDKEMGRLFWFETLEDDKTVQQQLFDCAMQEIEHTMKDMQKIKDVFNAV